MQAGGQHWLTAEAGSHKRRGPDWSSKPNTYTLRTVVERTQKLAQIEAEEAAASAAEAAEVELATVTADGPLIRKICALSLDVELPFFLLSGLYPRARPLVRSGYRPCRRYQPKRKTLMDKSAPATTAPMEPTEEAFPTGWALDKHSWRSTGRFTGSGSAL